MTAPSRPLLALAWMIGAVASFSAMAVAGRELYVHMNTFELMAYRSFIGLAIVAFIIARTSKGFAQIKTGVPILHLQRNVVHFTGQNLWFYGVAVIPLAELVSIEFTNPIWVALLAPLMLGESITRTRIIAAVLGFVGVLIVARPGAAALDLGHAAGLGAALGFALNTIFTRRLMNHDSVLCVLFWMTVLQLSMALVLALPGGIPLPNAESWPWLLVVGICGLTAHYSLTSALAAAPATIVAPMEFARLPVITILGMFLYDEPLVFAVFIGAAVIVIANLINLYGETRPSRTDL